MRKIIPIMLAFFVGLSICMVTTDEVQAAGAVKYTYTKVIKSSRGHKGHVKYPRLKGTSRGVQKINRIIKSDAKKAIKELVGIDDIGWDRVYEDWKVAYNKWGVISLKCQYKGWPMDYLYGRTFNRYTGKRLKLSEVTPYRYANSKALRSAIYKQLKEKYNAQERGLGTMVASQFKELYKSKKDLEQCDFYINEKGNVIVCFSSHVLANDSVAYLTVSFPSKYKYLTTSKRQSNKTSPSVGSQRPSQSKKAGGGTVRFSGGGRL